MTKRLPSLLLLGCAALLLSASVAEAQVVRPNKTLYISARVGLATYGGDADNNPDNSVSTYLEDGSIGGALELGYQFTPSLGFGVAFNYGDYSRLETDASDGSRMQIQAMFRYFMFPSSRITPYIQFGGGYLLKPSHEGQAGLEEEAGFGPIAGLGVDLLLGRQFSLFLEGTGAFYFPDEAVDGLNPGIDADKTDFDWLGLIGGGARFWFRPPITYVDATIDCVTSLEVGQAGTFTAFVNDDASGPLTYRWDWGDGTTSDGLVATHSYSTPGTYTVTFTATGPGNTDTETCLVTVTEPPAEPPVLASCTASPATAGVGETVNFSAEATGTRPITFEWQFGDGATASTLNATHVYNEVGTYTATLTATNEAGSDACTVTVTVIDRFCDEVTELNTVYFDRNVSTLDGVATGRLDENLAVLERCPDICVQVNGYTDSRERDPLRLSERRAAAVEAYYVQGGIDADRLRAEGRGVAPDDNYKEDRGAGSRRAESIPMQCSDF